jgi:hypothetical protein
VQTPESQHWRGAGLLGDESEPIMIAGLRFAVATALAAILASSLLGCAAGGRVGDGYVLEPEQLADERKPAPLAGRLVIVDVRPRAEFVQGHLDGSTWIDLKMY